MNQTCKVCGEPAAGFHFGAFTCEGCKSFFGRSYNNLSSITECKNNGKCIIDKKNRTTCKACRLRKCYTVGMSKGGSRYGRRSNWFKIHCLLQEQQQQAVEAAGKAAAASGGTTSGFGDMAAAAAAAQQHMHQRNSQLAAAQHMGGLLGYPGYLPDMMQSTSPFMSAAARHPADAAAAAALPFFSMMNSLPSIGSPQSAFQLPPHLLFPGYHPSSAAAADAAYRAEMYKHRQSVDSAASGESSQRFSPAAGRLLSGVEASEHVRAHSPELCVSGDDEEHTNSEPRSTMPQHSVSPVCSFIPHTVHSPIAIRATPKGPSPVPTNAINSAVAASMAAVTPPHTPAPATSPTTVEQATLSFTAKMQSLSPVSVCSIGAETAPATARGTAPADGQDCPMDLSMKTSRSSVHSFNTSAGESDVQSDSSEEELLRQGQALRRKFYQLGGGEACEHESDASSDASASEAVKRQKLAADVAATQNYGGFAHSARGIFVCV